MSKHWQFIIGQPFWLLMTHMLHSRNAWTAARWCSRTQCNSPENPIHFNCCQFCQCSIRLLTFDLLQSQAHVQSSFSIVWNELKWIFFLGKLSGREEVKHEMTCIWFFVLAPRTSGKVMFQTHQIHFAATLTSDNCICQWEQSLFLLQHPQRLSTRFPHSLHQIFSMCQTLIATTELVSTSQNCLKTAFWVLTHHECSAL